MENKSILIGNGINIQFGGNAYTNRFIMQRIILNAKRSKYKLLFECVNDTEQLIPELFCGLLTIANNIYNGKYDLLHNQQLNNAVIDFKKRYETIVPINHTYDIFLEDWFLLLELFYNDNPDIKGQHRVGKQAISRLICDGIFNDGDIQNLYPKMSCIKEWLSEFDNVFTINYDNNLDKLLDCEVYHLHGDFTVLADSENTKTAIGKYRATHNKNTVVINGLEHAFSNYILSYDGENKIALANSIAELNKLDFRNTKFEDIDLFESSINQQSDLLRAKKEFPNLPLGTDYHFNKLRNLSGELYILGVSPNNDRHLFSCIEESKVTKVYFYDYDGNSEIKLPIQKPYEIKSAKELWGTLNANPVKKPYTTKTQVIEYPCIDVFIHIFNSLSMDKYEKIDIVNQVNTTPVKVRNSYSREIHSILENIKKDSTDSKEVLMNSCYKITSLALRYGVLPPAMFMMYMLWRETDISLRFLMK